MARRKTQTDTQAVQGASIAYLEGSGERGAKARPFSHEAAVQRFEGWVYSAATINANAVASVPMRLYVRKRAGRKCLWDTRPVSRARKAYLKGDGKHQPDASTMRKAMTMGDFEEVVEAHPLTTLLQNVNPWLNGFDFTVLRILWGELTGNAYALLIHGAGKSAPPTELWPLPPQWTWVVPSRMNWIEGYLYGRETASRKKFEPSEVIHFKRPNPKDLFYGMGKVEGAWPVVSLNEANHAMDLATADNMGRPDYLVIVKGAQSDQLTRLDAQIKTQLKGTKKSGRWLSVGGETEIRPLQWPPKELIGRDDVVEEIAAVFGVPVSMLKANDPNLASAKVGYGMWREGTILPLCRMDEQVLNQNLVPLFDDNLMLAYDNPVPSDEANEREDTRALVGGGIVAANERRMELGYPPVDDPMADKLLVNGQPLGGYAPLPSAGPVVNVNNPAVPEAPAKPDTVPVTGQDLQTTEATVLNSAQISAAKDIVLAVVAGDLPRDAGIGMLQTFFNLQPENAEQIMGSAGKPGVATTPNPNPKEADDATGTSGEDSDGGADPADSGAGDADVGKAVGGAGAGGEVAEGSAAKGTGEGEARPSKESGMAVEEIVIPFTEIFALDGGEAAANIDKIHIDRMWNRIHAISHKALMLGMATLADCCPHHKGDADDTVRDDERETPIMRFTREMAAVFAKQRDAVATAIAGEKAITKGISQNELADILGEFNAELDAIIRPYLDQTTQAGGKAGDAKLTQAGKPPGPDSYDPFDVHNPRVSEYLDKYSVRLRGEIQGYSGEAIAKYVARSIEAGNAPSETARGLREDASAAGGSMSPNRAEMIARTESARGFVEGERMSWQESGVVTGKKWMLAADACPFCTAAAAQFNDKSTPLDQPFYRKGSTLTAADGSVMNLDYSDVQGPPLHPNDRCDLEPIL